MAKQNPNKLGLSLDQGSGKSSGETYSTYHSIRYADFASTSFMYFKELKKSALKSLCMVSKSIENNTK